jgi:predicted metal-dependent enzyme (double-stranded beta helix superfamily)
MSGTGYTLDAFVRDLRGALAQDVPEARKLDEGAAALARLLDNPDALAPYLRALDRDHGPWLLYEDDAYGFVVTLLLKPRGQTTPVHHHGEAWTLYGVFRGEELIHRYERHDDGSRAGHADVRPRADHRRPAGQVEVEPAYAIHNETTDADGDTIAIAVRGRDLATIEGAWFDLDRGTVEARLGKGARPIP